MTLKKSILSVIVLFMVSNLLTTLWYMLSDEANMVSFRREEMNYGGLMANHLIYALGFVYLFPYYYKVHPSFKGAFGFGLVLSAIMFIPTGIVVRSIWEVEFNSIFVLNCLAHMVIGGVMGIVLAIIYRFKNKNND